LSPGELGLPFVFGTPVRLSWTDHPMTDGDVRAGNILEVYDWDSGQKLTVDALTNVSGDQHYFDWTPPRPGRFKWRSQAGDGIDRGTWSDWGYFVVGAPPQVVSAAYIDFTHVDLVFTEGLNKASAEAAANYTVDHGGAVTGAVLQADGKTVRLTTAWQVGDTTYTVTAAGVKDVNGIVLITGTGDSASWSTPEAWRRCDLDGDGTLGVADMKLFMDSWRKQGLGHGTDAAADFDGDGKISQADAERIVHDYLSREGK
jgi:hypothetical protein